MTTRGEAPSLGGEGVGPAPGPPAAPAPDAVEAPSLGDLREAILRRIMRAACVVGVVGLVVAALFVRPFDGSGATVGVVALLVVFAATLLPRRLAVLSVVYPWALVLTGAGLAWSQGPRAEPFLLAAGGMFIGSLVLGGRHLVLLVAATLVAGAAALTFPAQPAHPGAGTAWLNAVSAMISVVAPAAIAGRMLVQALERALQERTALVRGLLAESRVREATVRALESTRTQLTHAQKMELIGQMAGGIAHDMNNALTAILGEASLLGDGAQEERERILEATAYAAKLTQQLMVFSRRDTTRPRPIDLTATMQGVVSALRRVVPSEIALGADLPREPIAVVADPTQILQVMLNLGANARDAMESGGALAIRVLGDAAARQAVIEVRDTGAGIPADVLPRIFEPFFTTKPSGKGTGLGLATVRQLVEAMGGSVEVRSQVGAGTTFTIRLPTTEAAVVEEPGRHVAPGSRSGTVLVVEDDVRVRAVILAALERAGYRMLEATSCEAARALLARRPEGVDLLLTDVVMPGGGAAELIRLVRERFPRTRVLVMSGYNADETLRRGVAQGAYPFIAKPFTADALARAIDAALA